MGKKYGRGHLEGVCVGNGGEDNWIWLGDGSNSYTVNSTYNILYGTRFDSSEVDILKTLWEIRIPQSYHFCCGEYFWIGSQQK